MKVNDRVTVKTDGGPRRPGVVLAIEEFNEGTMYLVSLDDYPLGIWFFNEKVIRTGFLLNCLIRFFSPSVPEGDPSIFYRIFTKIPLVTLSVRRTT